MKRYLAYILIIAILTTLFIIPVSSADTAGGSFGDGLYWEYENGELTISGQGATPLYNDSSETPWYSYKDVTTKVIIEEGIVELGDFLFNGFDNVKVVILPRSLKYAGFKVFTLYSTGINQVFYSGSKTEWSSRGHLKRMESRYFSNASIYYNLRYDNELLKVCYNEIKATAVTTLPDEYLGKTVSLSAYKDNSLVGIKTTVFSGENISLTSEDFDIIKLTVWENFANLKPVCTPITVTLEELRWSEESGNIDEAYIGMISGLSLNETPQLTICVENAYFQTFELAKTVKVNGVNIDNKALINNSEITENQPMAVITLNSYYQISEIYYGSGVAENKNYISVNENDVYYNATQSKLGDSYFNEDSILLVTKKTSGLLTDSDVRSAEKDILKENISYSYKAITDDGGNIVFILVRGVKYEVDKNSIPMYVTAIGTTLDSDGNTAWAVGGYVDGEYQDIRISQTGGTDIYSRKYKDPQTSEWIDAYPGITEINKGDIIQFNQDDLYDSDGSFVDGVRIIATYEDYKDGSIENEGAATQDDAVEGYIKMGQLSTIRLNRYLDYNDNITVGFDIGKIAALVQSKGLNTTLNRIFANTYSIADAETDEYYLGNNNDDYVLVYRFNDKCLGGVIFDTQSDFR